MDKVRIFSIATEAGTHFPGQCKAPDAILNAGLRSKLESAGFVPSQFQLFQENADASAAAKWQPGPKIGGTRNEANTLIVLENIYNDLVKHLKDDEAFSIFLGGDCTILQPVLSAMMQVTMSRKERDLGLIYMDGDVDLTVPAEAAIGIDRTGILDSMTMTHLTQRDGCLPSFKGKPFSSRPNDMPLVGANDVVFFGFDPLQPSPDHWAYLVENGFKAYTRPTVRKDPCGSADAALEWINSRKKGVVLHFDVDVIDSGEFPLANYPHYAGLRAEEAFAALETFLASPNVIGLTITEVNPNNDPDGKMVNMLVDAVGRGFERRSGRSS